MLTHVCIHINVLPAHGFHILIPIQESLSRTYQPSCKLLLDFLFLLRLSTTYIQNVHFYPQSSKMVHSEFPQIKFENFCQTAYSLYLFDCPLPIVILLSSAYFKFYFPHNFFHVSLKLHRPCLYYNHMKLMLFNQF